MRLLISRPQSMACLVSFSLRERVYSNKNNHLNQGQKTVYTQSTVHCVKLYGKEHYKVRTDHPYIILPKK